MYKTSKACTHCTLLPAQSYDALQQPDTREHLSCVQVVGHCGVHCRQDLAGAALPVRCLLPRLLHRSCACTFEGLSRIQQLRPPCSKASPFYSCNLSHGLAFLQLEVSSHRVQLRALHEAHVGMARCQLHIQVSKKQQPHAALSWRTAW
jgi:hypothetical protein